MPKKKRNEEPEWDSESESGSEESGFADEGSESGSESGSSEGSESESDDESEEGSDESSEYSSDSGADESMEDVGFPDEKVSRGNLFNEPSNNPKWTKFVPAKVVAQGLSYAVIFCACIILIPLVLIIGLSVGLTRGGNDNEASTPVPVPAPITIAPTVAPTIAETVEGVVLTSDASTTIFRDGVLEDVAVGDEGFMLVQNPPPGDIERASAYSLVQFDGIVGVDSDASSEEEYLNSIADLTVELCLSVAQVSADQTYTTCLLPPDSAFSNVDELSGATAPSYSIPGDCLNNQVVTFDVTTADSEVCVDIAPLLTYKAEDPPALRRRRQLAGADVKYLLMIDALEESDKPGTRFYSSQGSGGRAPTLSIEGANTCLTAAAVACRRGFRVLCSLVQQAGLESFFGSDKNKTVFAPLDEAFEFLDDGLLEAIEDPETLRNVLKHHVVPEKLMSTDLECNAKTNMEVGSTTTLCGNNIYQVLGGVSPGISRLAQVVSTDTETCYGVVHAIDQVLIPAANTTEPTCIGESTQTFADLCEQEEFSTLCSLLTSAGIVEIFSSGLYTIFAPTNDAFEKALAALGETIDFTDRGLITEVVLQHVISGAAITSDDLVCNDLIYMANGAANFVSCEDEVSISGLAPSPLDTPKVTETDIEGCNFIVHRVDNVIIPVIGSGDAGDDSDAGDDDDDDDDDDDGDDESEDDNGDGTTVVDVLSGDSDTFSSLVSFAQMADLVDALSALDKVTLFAPDNDAFTNLISSAPVLTSQLQEENWKTHLQDLLLYHAVPEKIASSDITNGQTVQTLNGDSIDFLVNKNKRVFVNQKIRVDNADAEAGNGFVHTIEAVLLPDWARKNVGDVIGDIPTLATLNGLIDQANLADSLSQEEATYTVFAPINDAIEEAVGTLAGTPISLDNIDTLTSVLNQHIVAGVYSASSLADSDELESAAGTPLKFETVDGVPKINGIEIVETDVLANNGIIHFIDEVLLPPNLLNGPGPGGGVGPMPGGGGGPMPGGGGGPLGPIGPDAGQMMSCSICSGEAGFFSFISPDSKLTIPDGINLPEIEETEATCTEIEQLCQSGFCTDKMCQAFVDAGAKETCGCQSNE